MKQLRNCLAILLLIFFSNSLLNAQDLLPDVSNVDGANVDESGITNIIFVRQSGGNDSNTGYAYNQAKQTIGAAFDQAMIDLDAGTKTKILIHPGTYRESIGEKDFSTGSKQNTLLVIEGTDADQVVWSGSSEYAPGEWTSVGNGVYRHSWNKDFGNYTPPSGPKVEVACRSELIVINDEMMKQIPLERYTISGGGSWGGNVNYAYTGFDDPTSVLTEGSFGVAERSENGNYIYVKPPSGTNWNAAKVEVATSTYLVRFKSKNGLVLRNLTVKHTANDHNDYGYISPLRFGSTEFCENVLIDNCNFIQNSANGLKPAGTGWTVRNNKFNYNGNSGINSSVSADMIVEDCEFNFNNWRGYAFGAQGGGISWYLAGAKIHECDGLIVQRCKAVGNLCNGLWYDVHLHDVVTDSYLSLFNRNSLAIELSNGPFLINRSLLVNPFNNPFNNSIIGSVTVSNTIKHSNSTVSALKDAASSKLQWYNRTDDHANKILILAKEQVYKDNIYYKENDGWVLYQDIWPAGEKTADYSFEGIDNVYYSPVNSATAFHNGGHGLNPGVEGDINWWKSSWLVSDNSTWQDPEFNDNGNFDFGLQSSSPVKSRENHYYNYKVPASLITETEAFFNWTNWGNKSGTLPTGFSGNIMPVVSLEYKTIHEDKQYEQGLGVPLKAGAHDDDGHITKVEFYVGATKVGEDNTAPYEYTVTGLASGYHEVSAKAIDNDGGTNTHTITIEVAGNLLPTCSLTSPSNDFDTNEGNTVTITADAEDQGTGSITKVEFYANDVKIGEDNTAPYTFDWVGKTAQRNVKITAKATDDAGAEVFTNARYVHFKAVVADGDVFSFISNNGGGGQALNAAGSGSGSDVNKASNLCGAHQRWVFHDEGSGEYALENVSTGLYLSAEGVADSSNVILDSYLGTDTQKWTINYQSKGWFNLTNVASGLRLDGHPGGVMVSNVPAYWARAQWELKRDCGNNNGDTTPPVSS